LPQSGSQPDRPSASAVVDSSILFSFINIDCLKQLAISFNGLMITPRLKGEIIQSRQLALVQKLIRLGHIALVSPSAEESFTAAVICAQHAYGKKVSEADREAIAIAKCRGTPLLFEDTPMAKVARDMGFDHEKMFNTVRCLKKLAYDGVIDERTALSHLAVINSKRTACRLRFLRWEEP
jgi:predicted nucleic acid-binding protein